MQTETAQPANFYSETELRPASYDILYSNSSDERSFVPSLFSWSIRHNSKEYRVF